MTASNMPPDPFGAQEIPDLAQFAANCFSIHTAMMMAGFNEMQALRFTIDLTVGMMNAAPKPK